MVLEEIRQVAAQVAAIQLQRAVTPPPAMEGVIALQATLEVRGAGVRPLPTAVQ